jgi:hypothetical protein
VTQQSVSNLLREAFVKGSEPSTSISPFAWNELLSKEALDVMIALGRAVESLRQRCEQVGFRLLFYLVHLVHLLPYARPCKVCGIPISY